MLVTIGNQLTIKNPTPELVNYCEQNLVIKNPDYEKKRRMNLWLGRTPEYLCMYESNGPNLIVPFGTLRDILPLIRGAEMRTAFEKDPETVPYNAKIPLYDYQEEAVKVMYVKKFGILQSRAGSGKTQMGLALACLWGQKTLWLTHTHDLLQQSKERAVKYIDPSLTGTITAGKVNIGSGITFATVQTMSKLDLDLYRNVWNVIIVDECHRVAGTPTAMTQFGHVLNHLCAPHKYGLSATVHRADGMIKATFTLLGNVEYCVPDSAVADKVMTVHVEPVPTTWDIDRSCLNSDGTINYTAMIAGLSEDAERNRLIADKVVENAGHSCLVLASRIKQLETIRDMLPPGMRDDSALITGKMTSKKALAEREQAVEQMRTEKKKILFATYNLCKEGLDVPVLDRLFLASPQKDYAVITQSIGRIARTAPGKQEPVCFDFVDGNVGYLARAYKTRCTTYRKNGCVMPPKKK